MEYKESQDESESAATSDESEESGIDMFRASTLSRETVPNRVFGRPNIFWWNELFFGVPVE